MLKASHIFKTYNSGQKIALDDFSLEVPEASIYGLLGPNGAGKTSFIRIINQITMADSGEIFLGEEKLQPKHIQNIGYMPEERGLYKNMSLGDQLVYFGELKGMAKNDAKEEAKKWFDILGMDHWWNKKLSELSKGMGQKIQFVVTVLHRPKLLILDEPFSGFDPVNANLIKDQIINLKDNGTTIILSTHRMESVEEMCDFVALINNSKKVLDGKVFEVREKFKNNQYQIVLQNLNAESFSNFKNKYKITDERHENGLTSFSMSVENQPELLKNLTEIGYVRNFQEKIPSMNEVFIKAVTN